MRTQTNLPKIHLDLEQNRTEYTAFPRSNYWIKLEVRRRYIPCNRFLGLCCSLLCSRALVRSKSNSTNQPKWKKREYIQWQPMHMIKVLCNKTRIILWERNMPLYYINNRKRNYNRMPWCHKVPSNISFLPTHFFFMNSETNNLSWQRKSQRYKNYSSSHQNLANSIQANFPKLQIHPTFPMRTPILS